MKEEKMKKRVESGLCRDYEESRPALINRWVVLGPCDKGMQFKNFCSDQGRFLLDPNSPVDGLNSPVCWQDWTIDTDSPDVPDIKEVLDITPGCGVFLAGFVYSRKHQQSKLVLVTNNELAGIVNDDEISFDVTAGKQSGTLALRRGWNLIVIKMVVDDAANTLFAGGLVDDAGNRTSEIFVKSAFMLGDDTDSQVFGKNPNDPSQAIEIGTPEDEVHRSKPDVVVYIPREGDDYNDGDNEHFLVFESPKSKTLLAMWTQGMMEPFGDNHIMLARSSDGINWSEPEWIVGTHKGTIETQASWGFPVVSKSGRIYCLYTKSPQGVLGGCTGIMGGLYSDDEGQTWTEGPDIKIPPCLEDPNDLNSKEVGGFIVWQKPFTDQHGRLLAGYTRSLHTTEKESCGHVMRFENIDDGPDIKDLQISWLTVEGNPIAMSDDSHCSEPSIVLLPDGRLFATVRTMTGYIWYSVSEDDGRSWTQAEVLRYKDEGEKVKSTLAPCPVYELNDGRFMLLYFNNNYYNEFVDSGKKLPAGMSIFSHRRPAFIAVGEFQPDAHQPIWFSEPKKLLDNDGITLSAKGTNELATYTSITNFNDKLTLWYPDRKYYLLGKFIDEKILAGDPE